MSAVWTLARLTWMRVRRGKTIWVSGLLVLVPLLIAVATLGRLEDPAERWTTVCELTLRSLVLLAPVLHLSTAVVEENEGKTYTYLWSRPVPRTALILGKLVALVPLIAAVTAGALVLAWLIVALGPGELEGAWLARAFLAAIAGIVAASCFAVGLGALFPRHPLVISLGYIFVAEQILPAVPAVRNISTLYHVQTIARLPSMNITWDGSAERALAALAILSALWLGLAIWRIRRIEFGGPDG